VVLCIPGDPQAAAGEVVRRLRHQRRDALGLGRPGALPDRASRIDGVPLTEKPVRSASELPWNAELPRSRRIELTGRSWSGAAAVRRVDVRHDGGATWERAELGRTRDQGWTQWSWTWKRPEAGAHELLARATDKQGRTQPLETPFNDNGYFFDAVVRHPVTVV
jgi:hypothetical protein